jgi:hypothetical protein
MTLSRSLAVLTLGAMAAVVVVALLARVSDGPISLFAGGPFRSGQLVSEGAVDWQPLANAPQVELQLVNPPRSRTTHLVVLDNQAYVPCGIVKVGPFVFLGQAFWKQWPYEVLEDSRVILRSHGRLYERRAVKVTDPELYRQLSAAISAKYHLKLSGPLDPERVWFFRLEPRGA